MKGGIKFLQSHLIDDFYLEKARGAYIRSRATWMEVGEKRFTGEKQTNSKIHELPVN